MPDADPAPENRLSDETSPYLLQHKDNPVHWRPWSPAALAEAQAADKPILLSVGYAACHWCHVMTHESFENPEIAALMNADFVNIKVDREERPDIDAIYQQALAMLGGHGGWPLTMFLTPEGEPFWGGTYFPARALYGRPGFPDVLAAVAKTYRAAPDRVRHNTQALAEGYAKLSAPRGGSADAVDPALADACAVKTLDAVDWTHGGLGGAPKFPQPSILTHLWAAHRRGADPRCGDAVLLTLRRMAEGGIFDHLGGGFARYATDAEWLVPHFEKMLYDNAQLLPLLAIAHAATGEALFRRRAEETAHWMISDMQTDEGGFASARDADSEGEEGAYYVWTEAEIDRLLPPETAALFKAVYDVKPSGNWEGKTILNRLALNRPLSDAEEDRLAAARGVLLAARADREAPLKDDKVLADWNGLAVRGLVRAGRLLDRADWIDAAARAFAFVAERMVDAARGPDRLLHSYRAGRARHDGTLDDYVQMALAALALFEVREEPDDLARAEAWAETIHRRFQDARPAGEGGGAYFFTADDADGLITRTKTAADNATPAGNGEAVQLFAALHALTGDSRWAERADAIVARFAGELAHNFLPFSSLIEGAVQRADGLQIVLVGAADDPRTQALRAAVDAAPLAHRVLRRIDPGAALPAAHPAAGKGLLETPDGPAPAAYLCRGPVCAAPTGDPADLSRRLAGL
ncbi:MAG: thioredoxin domain-containing protein [Alphaproteobacteria bacterium]|nr:thioredoxin domain-containing protein [Alphaproteobacteria bacterium]